MCTARLGRFISGKLIRYVVGLLTRGHGWAVGFPESVFPRLSRCICHEFGNVTLFWCLSDVPSVSAALLRVGIRCLFVKLALGLLFPLSSGGSGVSVVYFADGIGLGIKRFSFSCLETSARTNRGQARHGTARQGVFLSGIESSFGHDAGVFCLVLFLFAHLMSLFVLFLVLVLGIS